MEESLFQIKKGIFFSWATSICFHTIGFLSGKYLPHSEHVSLQIALSRKLRNNAAAAVSRKQLSAVWFCTRTNVWQRTACLLACIPRLKIWFSSTCRGQEFVNKENCPYRVVKNCTAFNQSTINIMSKDRSMAERDIWTMQKSLKLANWLNKFLTTSNFGSMLLYIHTRCNNVSCKSTKITIPSLLRDEFSWNFDTIHINIGLKSFVSKAFFSNDLFWPPKMSLPWSN